MRLTLYKNELSRQNKIYLLVLYVVVFFAFCLINPYVETIIAAMIFLLIGAIRMFSTRGKLLELNGNCLIIFKQNKPPSEAIVQLDGLRKLIVVKGHIYVFVYQDGTSIEARPFTGAGEDKKVIKFLEENVSAIPYIEIRKNTSMFEDEHGIYHDLE